MRTEQTGCAAWVELSGREIARLASMPFAVLPIGYHSRCGLEPGHAGRHVCIGQGSLEREEPTIWWIWWTDAGEHEIRAADACPVLGDDEHRAAATGCVLPLGHAGRHMFTA